MFAKEIDLNDRNAMINFLSNHFRYNTMNSWNRSTSYAHNVKLHTLDLPGNLFDKAYDFISAECPEFDDEYYILKHDFENETGYTIGTNGRSGGYLVLYELGTNKMGQSCVYPGRNIDMDADFDEWDDSELIERTKLVTRFDELCDDIVAMFIDYVKRSNIEKIEYYTKHEKLVASIPDEENGE